jgi:hypothetical protein
VDINELEELFAQRIVRVMNEALESDPKAIRGLVSCNDVLADHPSIQVQQETEGYSVGLLGLLNGIAGTFPDSYGRVHAIFDVVCPNMCKPTTVEKGTGVIGDLCPQCETPLVEGPVRSFKLVDGSKHQKKPDGCDS